MDTRIQPIICFYFISLLNLQIVNSIQNFVDFDEKETENDFITKCIIELSEREIMIFSKPTVVLIMGKEQTKSKTMFTNNLIKTLNHENIPYMTKVNDKILDASKAKYLTIAYFEDCDVLSTFSFHKIDDKVKSLVVIKNCSVDLCKNNYCEGIGNVAGKHDFSFFVEVSKDIYELYTFIPEMNSNTCKMTSGEPVKINICDKGKLIGKTIFPAKYPRNFKKCPIKLGIASEFPFSMINNSDSLSTYDHIDESIVKGMDFELIKIILNRLNTTIDLYYIYRVEENVYIDNTFLNFLLNGSLDICAGGLNRIYGDIVDYSGVYVKQNVVWMYYAERTVKTWTTLIPTMNGLYLFLVFYFSYSVVLFVILTFDKNESISMTKILLHAWGSLVGSTSLPYARTLKQKILNAVYLFMCLHLAVYMNIQLYSFYTIQDPPIKYKTNDEVMKSGKVPYLRPLAKYFVDDEKYIRFANTSIDCKSFRDCAEQSFIHKGMTVVIGEFALQFQILTAVNHEARMLLPVDNLLTVYYEILIRKGHPISKSLKKILERLLEGDINGKLLKEAVGLTVLHKANIATQTLLSKNFICQSGCTLTMESLNGVFYIIIFGWVASSFIFLVEIIKFRK